MSLLSYNETPNSMVALADFCSCLHEAKQGELSKYRDWDNLLEINIDIESLTLVIGPCPVEVGVTHRRKLLLRVETDFASNDLYLHSQVTNQDEPYLPISDYGAFCHAGNVTLRYARTSLIDIHLGREGEVYYVHLLVVDGDQPLESRQPVALRFCLSAQGCYQLCDGSHCPPVFPFAQFLSPPPAKPKLLTADFSTGAVLPWPVSLGLLMLSSALVGWICAVAGQSREGPGATMATLMLLLGTIPFFARRVGGYTLTGLLIVAAAGLLVSLAGFLFKANVVVFLFLLMGGLLGRFFCTNAYGKAKAGSIDLEKNQPYRTKFLATSTEQEQNMLWIGDFAIVLVIVVLLVWGYSSIQSWFN